MPNIICKNIYKYWFENSKNSFYSFLFFIIITAFCVPNETLCDEICDLVFSGCPEDFSGDTIVVPEEIVSLSKGIYTCEAQDVIEGIVDSGGPSSIVFIIDHSYSMMGLGNTYPGNDEFGARFGVVRDLLDTLHSINSSTEIGLVVFREKLYLDHKNNDLFVQLPDHDDQSYLPLIKLNSELSNGKKGIETIKDLLETDTINGYNSQFGRNVECVDLKYKPEFRTIGNTNINVAFDAAKEALKSSSNPEANRFIIFLSDGEPYPRRPQKPGGRDPFDFVNGEDTPTTFTVFFNSENIAPQSITDMTENISKNGYSKSNPSSTIWTIQADYQSLMTLLKKNIFNNILHLINSYPEKITVNGKTSTEYSNSIFQFQDRFSFNKDITEFSFDITYKIEDQTTKEIDDTTTKTSIVFKRSPGVKMPKGFKRECWNRSIGFYFDNRKIDSVDETMDDLEIRFQSDPGEADYYYTSVKVDIMNTESGRNDKETYSLDKKGSVFSKSFKRIIRNNSSQNGTLEHLETDSIIAIFRNPDIALDSMRISIPFGISKVITVKNGTYFDTNADGFIDSIFIKTAGELIPEDLPDFIEALQFPSIRNFSIKDASVSNNGVSIIVDEEKKLKPRTNTTEDDILTINRKSFSHGGILLKHSSQFIDKMAPVIINANLIKYNVYPDTLIVIFSEPVKDIRRINPFYFRNPVNGCQYIAYVKQYNKHKSTNSNSNLNYVHFHINKIEGINNQTIEEMNSGDSIWIKTDIENNVIDLLRNDQRNPDNVRTVLTVKYMYVPVDFNLLTTTPIDIKKMNPIPTFISSIPEISSFISKKKFVRKNGLFQGMVIMAKPDNPSLVTREDRFTAVLSIFDPVSNTVVHRESMGYYNGNGDIKNCALFFAWDGTNTRNRYVAPGTYVVIAEITRFNKFGEVISSIDKRAFLGIKK